MFPGHIGEGGRAHRFITNTHPIPVNCSGRRCESQDEGGWFPFSGRSGLVLNGPSSIWSDTGQKNRMDWKDSHHRRWGMLLGLFCVSNLWDSSQSLWERTSGNNSKDKNTVCVLLQLWFHYFSLCLNPHTYFYFRREALQWIRLQYHLSCVSFNFTDHVL